MADKTLAVKYRPKTFADVTEQGYIVQILENQLKSKTFKQAYLFCGAAGTGKTTCARIFANELNGRTTLPIELDAARNSGVDEVRSVIDAAQFKPLDGEYKIFIIDECHSFSGTAWDAMLKVLEEPPSQVIFIFCTTDPQKIKSTILSRVQRYNFSRISAAGIFKRLSFIVKEEKLKVEPEALEYIAKIAEGGMREGISTLDKCLSLSGNKTLTLEGVQDALGLVSEGKALELLSLMRDGKADAALDLLYALYAQGVDLKQFVRGLIYLLLDLAKYNIVGDFKHLRTPKIYETDFKKLKLSLSGILWLLELAQVLQNDIKYDANCLYLVEAWILSVVDKKDDWSK